MESVLRASLRHPSSQQQECAWPARALLQLCCARRQALPACVTVHSCCLLVTATQKKRVRVCDTYSCARP